MSCVSCGRKSLGCVLLPLSCNHCRNSPCQRCRQSPHASVLGTGGALPLPGPALRIKRFPTAVQPRKLSPGLRGM